MAVKQETKLTLGASNNGSDTDALQLLQTATKVFIKFAGAGTLTPKQGTSEDGLIAFKVTDGETWSSTITGSMSFIVEGPGVLAFGCADIDDVITIEIDEVLC